jgi:N-acetylglucosamine-6-phosphate deacetylase
MSDLAIHGVPILAKGVWHDDHALIIQAGVVTEIRPLHAGLDGLAVERVDGGYLLPGFIDTQVNGGGGVLFNDHPTVEAIATIAATHRKFGTTALLPTLISDDLSIIEKAIAAVDEAIRIGVPGVVGIHIEGPFLNIEKRGIHDASKFRSLDQSAIELLSSLKNGKTLVTLAPECVKAGDIAQLTKAGVLVAAGHSMASYNSMSAAVSEGLSGVTHLYNAMSPLGSREPGMVGAAMDFRLYSGLIVDGHHVHPATLRTAFRAKGADELMLVTDAMPSVGHDDSGFALGDVWINNEAGVLRGPDGTLAGSNLDMGSAVRNAVAMMKVDLATASQMASRTPAAFLGLSNSYGDLSPGYRADIVHLDAELNVRKQWVAGEMLPSQ